MALTRGKKVIEFVILIALVLTVLTQYLAPLIVDAMKDKNLSGAGAALLVLIIVMIILGLVYWAYETFFD
jgi:hypothetical protein